MGTHWMSEDITNAFRAWQKATENPIAGSDQRDQKFTEDLAKYFEFFRQKSISLSMNTDKLSRSQAEQKFPQRTGCSVKSKVNSLKKYVLRFLKHYHSALKTIPSGVNNEDTINAGIIESYRNKYAGDSDKGGPQAVDFISIIDVLKAMPLYSQAIDPQSEVAMDTLIAPPTAMRNTATSSSRPIGSKKAKRRAEIEKALDSKIGEKMRSGHDKYLDNLKCLEEDRKKQLLFEEKKFDEKKELNNLKLVMKYCGGSPESESNKKTLIKMKMKEAINLAKIKELELEEILLDKQLNVAKKKAKLDETNNRELMRIGTNTKSNDSDN